MTPTPARVDRNAALYLVALGCSAFGSSAFTSTAGIWVKTLTDSDALAGLVAFCVWAPTLLAPLWGLLADRVRRRRLVVVTNLAMAVLLLPLLFVRDGGEVWLLFAVMVAYGFALAVPDPAEFALLAGAVPAETLGRLNGLRTMLNEGAKLVAPLLGAGIFVLAGGGVLALVDAATFLVAVTAYARMRVVDAVPERSGTHWLADLRAGLRHVWDNRALATMLVGSGIVLAFNALRTAAMFTVVDETLDMPPAFLGVLTAMQGVGSILGGLLSVALLRRPGREGRLAAGGIALSAVGGVLICLPWTPTVAAGMVFGGLGLPWLLVAGFTAVQLATPDALQGRAASIATMLLFTGQILAIPAGSLLVTVADHRLPLVTFVVVAVACACLVWRVAGRSSSVVSDAV